MESDHSFQIMQFNAIYRIDNLRDSCEYLIYFFKWIVPFHNDFDIVEKLTNVVACRNKYEHYCENNSSSISLCCHIFTAMLIIN